MLVTGMPSIVPGIITVPSEPVYRVMVMVPLLVVQMYGICTVKMVELMAVPLNPSSTTTEDEAENGAALIDNASAITRMRLRFIMRFRKMPNFFSSEPCGSNLRSKNCSSGD